MSLSRYPTYKCSAIPWLKELPEHWGVCPLKSLLSIENGLDHKEVVSDEGWPVFGSGGPFAQASNYLYDGETILLGRKGTIDKPLYYSGKFWAVDTMYWSKVKPGCVGRFVYFSCLSIPFSYYQTSTALPSMTKSSLGSHPVCLPPAEEQLVIASFLDRETAKIDALIAEQQRLIELLQEKRQAVISHAVSKGLNPNALMKDSGLEWLGEVPEHWEVGQLRRFAKAVKTGRTPDESDFMEQEIAIPWFTPGSFNESTLAPEAAKYVSIESVNEGRASLFPGNSVLVVGIGATLGKVGVPGEECSGNQQINAIEPSEKLEPAFLSLFLTAAQEQMRISSNASTLGIMNQQKTKELVVSCPPLAEQRQIIDYANKVVAGIIDMSRHSQRAIELLQERRSVLISAAVTGKIDVRGLVKAQGGEQ